jgi:cytochrome b6-f complex iron-sulfur subunit
VAVIIIGVVLILVAAAVFLLGTARRRATTGRLSRGTRRADTSEVPPGAEPAALPDEADAGAEPGEDARARADESRRAIESGGSVLVPAGERAPARYEPVDEEELGVTRRQFFNRGILTAMGLAVGGFGAAALAFVWPSGAGSAGTEVTVGTLDQIKEKIDAKEEFYNASARVYIQPYPKEDLEKAAKVYPSTILAGMEQGYVALYQKCPHLGCRVPWCQTSQWFECPCHGSKYNRVGEKRGGPAPRGMDRFPLQVTGNSIIVDTDQAKIVQGPPIGTDTTGQGQEGAPCV